MPSRDGTTAFLCTVFFILVALYSQWSRKRRSGLPLPPGPPKLPLVGNLFDLPASFQWETYMKWSKEYGSDIIHLNLASTSLIVLSSLEATTNLLERRSSIYSDRPVFPMLDLMGCSYNVGLMKYGDDWRTNRRLLNQNFNANAARQYRPRQSAAARGLLKRLLGRPEAFMEHFDQMAGDVIVYVTYGIDVLPSDDPYISLAKDVAHITTIAAVPGRFLIDAFPLLKHVPKWLYGAGFRRKAEEWRTQIVSMLETPFAETQRQMESGAAERSFTADALQGSRDGDAYYREEHIKASAATLYGAGVETTVAGLGTFVLAMLANPEAQRRAQAELDSVTGGKYLPDFDDEASLPYVSALVKEVLRWKNATPFAIPHLLTKEDEYRGYRLPAGSLVIGNTWAIMHDEDMYPDPYAFKPERFLIDGKPNPAVKDPDAAFGFGRRICPGRHLATSLLWITAVSVLSTFNIQKAVDERGNIIEPTGEYLSALVSVPLPFKCSIVPRSERAAALIKASC